MSTYDHKKIESKWQKIWEETGINKQETDPKKKKCYVLDMFPYISGAGLHVGHPKGYIGTDIYSRYQRMRGKAVLHPMGWDAFGLPAENYAIKNKEHPRIAVEKNVARFKEQLGLMGFDYDWSREINTTDPEYYKWTQWMFLQMWKKGLAYESNEAINWCPSCQTGLANEDLENGKCERCGSQVEKKRIRQWVLAITKYADRLLKDLDTKLKPPHKDLEFTNRSGVPLFVDTSKEGHVQDGMPIVERQAVAVIVKHWSEDKYIGLKWKKVDWQTVITGGVEEGQTPQEAAVAEIREETGYLNPKFVKSLGQVDSNFHHVPKNVNRLAHFDVLYFELSDDERQVVSKEENSIHELVWLSKDEMSAFISPDAQKYMWETLFIGKPNQYKETEYLLNWPENIKEQQRQWIGRSEGLIFKARVKDTRIELKTFSAHYEACYADTFVVIAPDHILLDDLIKGVPDESKIRERIEEINIKRLQDKYATGELEGVFTRRYLDDPLGNGHLPIWVANFALSDYGTGIIRCSAHDPRDFAFAQKYQIPLKVVLVPKDEELRKKVENLEVCYSDMKNGILLEPLNLSGKTGSELRELIAEYVIENKWAKRAVMYKLRDWVFSRQRYWGEPIPLIHCLNNLDGKKSCGVVPVPENDLPVKLPDVKNYAPTGTGESPLADIPEWVNVGCPKCGGSGKRETNTMPQWAGSSWYYLAYTMRKINGLQPNLQFANGKKEMEREYWLPIDMYVGGAEHATRHLIYARFWHKFLYDIGVVGTIEPFMQLRSVGLILASDGRKMSKRYGNVINPDDVIERWGADTFRLHEMFLGPFSATASWNDESIIGPRRFLEKVWRLRERVDIKLENSANVVKHVNHVSDDIADFKFNTAISALMMFVSQLEKLDKIAQSDYETLLKLLAPFAPHITDELWSELGYATSIHVDKWPVMQESSERGVAPAESEFIELPVQVNGKVRASIFISPEATEDEVTGIANESPTVNKWFANKKVHTVIYKKGKILSLLT
ncbi:MAG TPA: class I tRNA ligase family protein [Candidatus Paceibacterota bacterium]